VRGRFQSLKLHQCDAKCVLGGGGSQNLQMPWHKGKVDELGGAPKLPVADDGVAPLSLKLALELLHRPGFSDPER
jgi:hypothetical protein